MTLRQDLRQNCQLCEDSVFSWYPSITAWLWLLALLNSDPEMVGPVGLYFLHLSYGFFFVLTRQGWSAHKEHRGPMGCAAGVSTELWAAQVVSNRAPSD